MYLRKLYLQNFRSYESKEVIFEEGVNLFYGPNACGKTTILEAIAVLITGKSFRTSKLTHLIRHGANGFFIRANFVKEGIEQTLSFGYDGKERKILHNTTLCSTTAKLFGILNGVIMTPDDLELIKAAPAKRRRFLDLQIAQANPIYVEHFSRFVRAMQQRNALLKERQTESLQEWENVMAQSAAVICCERYKATEGLSKQGGALFSAVSGYRENLSLKYHSFTPTPLDLERTATEYKERLRSGLQRDLEQGVTRVGPHRDDLLVYVDEGEARYFASEGQQRSCVAAMRFAEWEQLQGLLNLSPLLLFDDIGVSLDSQRQNYLLSQLGNARQVLLTATDEITDLVAHKQAI